MSEIKNKPALSPADRVNDLISAWQDAKAALDNAKAAESLLRERVVAAYFANAEIGTSHHVDGDRDVVCVKKYSYTLDKAGTSCAQQDIAVIIGVELAQRLVNWKPELSVSEYKKLPDAARVIIDNVLTIKPATPTIEVKVAK
jgi:hypothetical protein